MCSSGHGYIEYGRYKNGKTVQPDARLENTAGNAGSSKYLFIYLTKAEPNSLNRSYHPHLPRFGGKKEIIEKISQSITEKNHHYRKTIAESLAGSTGKRPSAELRHECGGTHHPPQHFSSAFKIVTGIGRKGSKNPSLYYKVVVYSPYPRGVCYTVKDAVDWLNPPTARRFRIGSNHSPLQYC